MLIKTLFTICSLLFLSMISFAQCNIDKVLAEIEVNNKTLAANKQYWEAKKLFYKTGLALDNPTVAYEYLSGFPVGAGDQQDFSVIQSFDFPTAYVKKKQVTKYQITQDEFKQMADRQNVLLKAKQYCLELIYLNKQKRILEVRLKNVQQLHSNYVQKLNSGSATSLEVSKVKLELLSIGNGLRTNNTEINLLNDKLTELNGGVELVYEDTIYKVVNAIPDFIELEANIEANDPVIKSIQEQKTIDQKKLELSKAMALPRFEGGYHYQTILSQTYQGVHVGMTIPLWESKNTVKHQKAHLIYNELQVEDHKNEHHYEIKQLFEKYKNLQKTLEEYQSALTVLNSQALLDRALELGEISSIQYFLEISYYYNFYDNFLKIEKEYYQVIADIYKYQL
jgi:cobalt-zinc-cadmium efflux system outer membrane protein